MELEDPEEVADDGVSVQAKLIRLAIGVPLLALALAVLMFAVVSILGWLV